MDEIKRSRFGEDQIIAVLRGQEARILNLHKGSVLMRSNLILQVLNVPFASYRCSTISKSGKLDDGI